MGIGGNPDPTLVRNSKIGLKNPSIASTDSRQGSPSFRQPFPPPRRVVNPSFKGKEFYALLWAAVNPAKTTQSNPNTENEKSSESYYREKIDEYMQRLHQKMQTNGDTKACLAYQNTAEKSFVEMGRVLKGLQKTNFDSEQIQLLQTRFAGLVESVFEIFLPVQWQTAMAARYWGAAITALTVCFSDPPHMVVNN